MFCEKCGTELNPGEMICPKCKAIIKSALIVREEDTGNDNLLVSESEKMIENIKMVAKGGLFRKKKCNAVLSDKRLYLKGKMETQGSKKQGGDEERIIDLQDIVCTGLASGSRSIKLFILMILEILLLIYLLLVGRIDPFLAEGVVFLFLFALVLIITGVIWYISVETKFIVEYAGGRIIIDTSANRLSELRSFHSKIRLAKDERVYGEKNKIVVDEQ